MIDFSHVDTMCGFDSNVFSIQKRIEQRRNFFFHFFPFLGSLTTNISSNTHKHTHLLHSVYMIVQCGDSDVLTTAVDDDE